MVLLVTIPTHTVDVLGARLHVDDVAQHVNVTLTMRACSMVVIVADFQFLQGAASDM